MQTHIEAYTYVCRHASIFPPDVKTMSEAVWCKNMLQDTDLLCLCVSSESFKRAQMFSWQQLL